MTRRVRHLAFVGYILTYTIVGAGDTDVPKSGRERADVRAQYRKTAAFEVRSDAPCSPCPSDPAVDGSVARVLTLPVRQAEM
jgi:hypothetical protein